MFMIRQETVLFSKMIFSNFFQKVLYGHIFPSLVEACQSMDTMLMALPSLMALISTIPAIDYADVVMPEFRLILNSPKPIQVCKKTDFHKKLCTLVMYHLGRVKRICYLWRMRAAKVQASLRIRAVLTELPLLAHTSSKSRGTFRQKASSLAPLNGRACAVKICHDRMLEDIRFTRHI